MTEVLVNPIRSACDTTFRVFDQPRHQPELTLSIFTGHQLQSKTFHLNEVKKDPADWILGVVILCLILITWAHVFYSSRIKPLFLAPVSRRHANLLIRDGDLFTERLTLSLSIVYVLAFSLLLYELNVRWIGIKVPEIPDYTVFGLIALSVTGYNAIKLSLMRFLGTVFKTNETTVSYQQNHLIMTMISGPVILVFLIPVLFSRTEVWLYLCLAISILLIFFRLVRGLFIGMSLTKFSYLFLFVYLCSLEILPLFILAKVLLIR